MIIYIKIQRKYNIGIRTTTTPVLLLEDAPQDNKDRKILSKYSITLLHLLYLRVAWEPRFACKLHFLLKSQPINLKFFFTKLRTTEFPNQKEITRNFFYLYIFAIWCCTPLIFQAMNYVRSKCLSLKFLRSICFQFVKIL